MTMAGNPNWEKGGISPNPNGRKKTRYSVKTPRGIIENFIKKNFTQRKLQSLFEELTPLEKAQTLIELMKYITIPDTEIKKILTKQGISIDQINRHPEVLDLHRLQIETKRELKNYTK